MCRGEKPKREKSRSPKPQIKRSDNRASGSSKTKMSEEEKAKKLREMMSNADWRDEQRTKRNYFFSLVYVFFKTQFLKKFKPISLVAH